MDELEAEETGPERRCVVTGTRRPKAEMIRFVVSPGGEVTPDLAETLPGRGFWLSAARDVVETAQSKRMFARAARKSVTVPEDLADKLEALLARRCGELLGLARRSGLVVGGFEKVRGALKSGEAVAYLMEAQDGARDGRDKIAGLAPHLTVVQAMTARELGLALGRDSAVHLLVKPGRLAKTLKAEAFRLARYRGLEKEELEGDTTE